MPEWFDPPSPETLRNLKVILKKNKTVSSSFRCPTLLAEVKLIKTHSNSVNMRQQAFFFFFNSDVKPQDVTTNTFTSFHCESEI